MKTIKTKWKKWRFRKNRKNMKNDFVLKKMIFLKFSKQIKKKHKLSKINNLKACSIVTLNYDMNLSNILLCKINLKIKIWAEESHVTQA